MRRPPPSLRLSWTLNLNYKTCPSNNLGPLFFLFHLASLTIFSFLGCLFICAYIFPFRALSYCYELLSLCWFCCFALSWCLATVSPWCCRSTLFLAPPCYYALLFLLHLVVVLLAFLPCNVAASPPLLFFCLL